MAALSFALALAVCGGTCYAQQPAKVYRIGFLGINTPPAPDQTEPVFSGGRPPSFFGVSCRSSPKRPSAASATG